MIDLWESQWEDCKGIRRAHRMHSCTNLVKATFQNNRSLSSCFSSLKKHDQMLTFSSFCCRSKRAAKDCEFSKKKAIREEAVHRLLWGSDSFWLPFQCLSELVFRFFPEQQHPGIGSLSPGGEVYDDRSQQGH